MPASLRWTNTKRSPLPNWRLTSANLRPRYAAIFSKVFTDAEMIEIATFYESEAGKASVRKRPQIAALIQEQYAVIGEEFGRNLASAQAELQASVRKSQGK
jgi:hypothetical protein